MSGTREASIYATTPSKIANKSIPFDPEYEQLTLHFFDVIRNGERIEKLDFNKVNLIQRETGLEYGIYDGQHYATLFLEDIRQGDILDYSYSI